MNRAPFPVLYVRPRRRSRYLGEMTAGAVLVIAALVFLVFALNAPAVLGAIGPAGLVAAGLFFLLAARRALAA